jgi:hypothetical protein
MCRLTSSEAANFTELHKESVLPLWKKQMFLQFLVYFSA